jgi:hypothetical protein
MSKTFETEEDRKREHLAIDLFCKKFLAKWEKLEKYDIDYKITRGDRVCYVEVKGRNRMMANAYPLPVAARKMVKLVDKKKPAIIIWACYDGLIYANIKDLESTGKIGGRFKKREGSSNDQEYMLYFDKQDSFFTINN